MEEHKDAERELLQMGFGRKRVREALRGVGSKLESALSWLLDGAGAAASTSAPTEESDEGAAPPSKRRASLRHVRRKTTPRPLLHPEVKKMMEGFFEHVKSTDPDQQAVTACNTRCNRK